MEVGGIATFVENAEAPQETRSIQRAGSTLIVLRDARVDEAESICEVLRRSIIELCEPDHRNDPALLDTWLSNKTTANIRKWLNLPGSSFLVAIDHEVIAAVASVSDQGVITLNYVSPAFRFKGISRALLRAMEVRALQRGARQYTLVSTQTAHRFYRDAGYRDDPPSENAQTDGGYRMHKPIPD